MSNPNQSDFQSNLNNGKPQPLPKHIVVSGQRINLHQWKAKNVRDSVLLGIFTVVMLVAIAYLIAIAIEPAAAFLFILIALVISLTQNVGAFWFSDQIALHAARARKANKEEHRYLVNITEAVAIGAGVPMPEIYVIDSPAPNAFATGRNPKHSAVAVTTGLMSILDRQELEGVIAHEIAHIKNQDILFTSMIAATVGAIIIMRDLFYRSFHYGSRGGMAPRRSSRGEDGGGQAQAIAYLLLILLLILGPILAMMIRYAVSRKREYVADATGAYITRNPEGLARALIKLQNYSGAKLEVSEGVRHMFFTNPAKSFNAKTAFSTHPPIEERIDRLRRM